MSTSIHNQQSRARARARAHHLHNLYELGLSVVDIARMQDPPISNERVLQIFERYGLPVRTTAETIRIKKQHVRA